jgi:hypothetical protein
MVRWLEIRDAMLDKFNLDIFLIIAGMLSVIDVLNVRTASVEI